MVIEKSTWETMFGTCTRIYGGLGSVFSRLLSTSTKRTTYKVAVEGNIGSGKTTLIDYFASDPNVETFAEPVKKWRNIRGHNALALMYEDPARWSMTLQTYVQLTMLETHMQQTTKPVKLMERSIYSAKYCFVENLKQRGHMPDIDYTILSSWFDFIIKNEACDLDLIVYLRTNPKTIADRIKKRGRREEKPIPMSYLESLHQLHEDWLIHKKNFPLPCPVLVIEADENEEEMKKLYSVNRHQIMGVESI